MLYDKRSLVHPLRINQHNIYIKKKEFGNVKTCELPCGVEF